MDKTIYVCIYKVEGEYEENMIKDGSPKRLRDRLYSISDNLDKEIEYSIYTGVETDYGIINPDNN